MHVNASSLAELITERDHLREQVTRLQERGTELVMENRELRKPWVVIESDFKTGRLLAVRLWSSDTQAKADLDEAEAAGDTRVCAQTKLDSGENILELYGPVGSPVSGCCGAPIVQAEGKTIDDYPVCSKCDKPAGV